MGLIFIVIGISGIKIITSELPPTKIEYVIWKDDIRNPNNSEFVNEVVFNINYTIIITNFDKYLQLKFCERYYNSLDNRSKLWYDQNK